MSTTNTTQDLPQYKTYAEFVNALPGILQKQYDDNVAALNSYQARQEAALKEQQRLAELSAHKGLQRAYVDTDTSYQQAVATYGANAQKLAGMGLAGSGYSDYLTASAYAANRANKAVADAQHSAAVSDANQVYYTAKNTLDDTIAQRMNELGNSYTANLLSAHENALKYQKELAQNNSEILYGSGDTVGAYQEQVGAGIMSETQAKEALKAEFTSAASTPYSFDFDKLAEAKDILGSEYDTVLQSVRDNITLRNAFTDGESELDFDSAAKAIENYRKLGLDDDTMRIIEEKYDSQYGIHGNLASDASKVNVDKKGRNFTVTLQVGNGKYDIHVQSGGKVEGTEMEDALLKMVKGKVQNNSVFEFRDSVYLYHDGELYHVEHRPVTRFSDQDFKSLREYLRTGDYEKFKSNYSKVRSIS